MAENEKPAKKKMSTGVKIALGCGGLVVLVLLCGGIASVAELFGLGKVANNVSESIKESETQKENEKEEISNINSPINSTESMDLTGYTDQLSPLIIDENPYFITQEDNTIVLRPYLTDQSDVYSVGEIEGQIKNILIDNLSTSSSNVAIETADESDPHKRHFYLFKILYHYPEDILQNPKYKIIDGRVLLSPLRELTFENYTGSEALNSVSWIDPETLLFKTLDYPTTSPIPNESFWIYNIYDETRTIKKVFTINYGE
jgi:hypothetical protein